MPSKRHLKRQKKKKIKKYYTITTTLLGQSYRLKYGRTRIILPTGQTALGKRRFRDSFFPTGSRRPRARLVVSRMPFRENAELSVDVERKPIGENRKHS